MKAVAIFTVLFLRFTFLWVFHMVLFCQTYCCWQTACLNALNCHLLILLHYTRALQARRHFQILFMKMPTILLGGTWPEIFMIFLIVSYSTLFSGEKICLLVSKKLALQFISWSSKNREVWLCFKRSFIWILLCSSLKPGPDIQPPDTCI